MRRPPVTMPRTSHPREPDIPRRKPVLVRRRSNASNMLVASDPFDLEDHLTLLALALAEPVRSDDDDHCDADRDGDRGHLHFLHAFVDLAAQLAQLRLDVVACDLLGWLLERLGPPAHLSPLPLVFRLPRAIQ